MRISLNEFININTQNQSGGSSEGLRGSMPRVSLTCNSTGNN